MWISTSAHPFMLLWVEPAGGEQKSDNIEQKTVMLIYPYPRTFNVMASAKIVIRDVLF
jgi:hypothetical protein